MDGGTTKYFMWEWQHLFQGSACFCAKRLLNLLDTRLDSDVFLVGFLVEEIEDRWPICVFPDDCPYQPDLFEDVERLASQIVEADPARVVRYSAPTPPGRA